MTGELVKFDILIFSDLRLENVCRICVFLVEIFVGRDLFAVSYILAIIMHFDMDGGFGGGLLRLEDLWENWCYFRNYRLCLWPLLEIFEA